MVAVSAVVALASATAGAAPMTLQNDSFDGKGDVVFQEGFAPTDMGAATLGPVNESFSIDRIRFLFGPDGGMIDVTLNIYDEANPNAPPIFTSEYQVTPAIDAIQEIDLTGDNVVVPGGSIRVAIQVFHSDTPSIARDDDGQAPGRNWIWDSGWIPFEDFTDEGDWIIRADIDTMGPATTSASGSGAGGAGAGGSGAGAGVGSCTPGETRACVGEAACNGGQSCLLDGQSWSPCDCGDAPPNNDDGDSGGCACTTPGSTGGARFLGWVMALAALLALGERRARRS
jgi:MYXO-CTERM domain-containing protein